MPSQDELIEPIAYSIKGGIAASGSSRSRIFEWIRDGEVIAYKDGSKTLLDGPSLRAKIKSLPRARRQPKPDAAA
jgi:hypothetical protein